jgi:hypothetical protein
MEQERAGQGSGEWNAVARKCSQGTVDCLEQERVDWDAVARNPGGAHRGRSAVWNRNVQGKAAGNGALERLTGDARLLGAGTSFGGMPLTPEVLTGDVRLC